jgi:hypothetical protein
LLVKIIRAALVLITLWLLVGVVLTQMSLAVVVLVACVAQLRQLAVAVL